MNYYKKIKEIRNEMFYPNAKTYMVQAVDDNGNGQVIEDTGLITKDTAMAIKEKYVNDDNIDICIWCDCKTETDYHTALYDKQRDFGLVDLYNKPITLQDILILLENEVAILEIHDKAIWFNRNGEKEWYIDLTKEIKDQEEETLKEIYNLIKKYE
jgi:hypothetical protein